MNHPSETVLGAVVVFVGVFLAELMPRLSAIGAAFGGALAAYGYCGHRGDLDRAKRDLKGTKAGHAEFKVMGMPVKLDAAMGTDEEGKMKLYAEVHALGGMHEVSGTLVPVDGDDGAFDVTDVVAPLMLASKLKRVRIVDGNLTALGHTLSMRPIAEPSGQDGAEASQCTPCECPTTEVAS